ncbi:MAG: hypothetical protein AB1627_15405 [Chloroflexota bacterium]
MHQDDALDRRTGLTADQRRLRARAAAYALHATGGTTTKAGTAAFLARFEAQVDPDGRLDPVERSRRALFARKSYMSRLALKASRARLRNNRMASPAIGTPGEAASEVGDVSARPSTS